MNSLDLWHIVGVSRIHATNLKNGSQLLSLNLRLCHIDKRLTCKQVRMRAPRCRRDSPQSEGQSVMTLVLNLVTWQTILWCQLQRHLQHQACTLSRWHCSTALRLAAGTYVPWWHGWEREANFWGWASTSIGRNSLNQWRPFLTLLGRTWFLWWGLPWFACAWFSLWF